MDEGVRGGLVSVVIPTFNSASTILDAIDSVLCQTYPQCEIIVVDDGSTDDTKLVLARYRAQGLISYVEQSNTGPGGARNKGIANCYGEFVAFLDADDVWLPTRLAKQIALFDNPCVGLVYGNMMLSENSITKTSFFTRRLPVRGAAMRSLIHGNFIPTSSVVIRKDILLFLKGFNESRELFAVEDYHAWLRMAAICEFDYVPSVIGIYRVHSRQISRRSLTAYRSLCAVYRNLFSDSSMKPWRVRLVCMYVVSYFKLRIFSLFKI